MVGVFADVTIQFQKGVLTLDRFLACFFRCHIVALESRFELPCQVLIHERGFLTILSCCAFARRGFVCNLEFLPQVRNNLCPRFFRVLLSTAR